jgi:predicted ATPase/serine/threonine protein kinase/Tfp pilus assembly protein PilF
LSALFADRYRLIERLGRGGMGDVWLAEQQGPRGFRRRTVIKRIHTHLADDNIFVASFEDEARLAAQLDHPFIGRVEDFGEVDGTLFLVMEYVQGANLKTLVERGEGLGSGIPTPLILKVIADTARALDYAHAVEDLDGLPLKVIHRDVSPQNIMVTPTGGTKLLDFGVARSAGQQQSTRAGTIKGKLAYLSPEQVRSLKLDGRSDLFSLGVILWELLCRQRLFKGSDQLKILHLIGAAEIPHYEIKSDCPDSILPVLKKALQRSAKKRYPDGGSFADAIEACLNGIGGQPNPSVCSAWLEQLSGAPQVELLTQEQLAEGEPAAASKDLPDTLEPAPVDEPPPIDELPPIEDGTIDLEAADVLGGAEIVDALPSDPTVVLEDLAAPLEDQTVLADDPTVVAEDPNMVAGHHEISPDHVDTNVGPFQAPISEDAFENESSSWTNDSKSFTAPIDINQSNLPRHMTRFIGRDNEVARLHELLAEDHRLITVLGPGGMGKSRLAIHYASRFLSLFNGGAWFVDLSDAQTLESVLAATSAALNVTITDESSDKAIEHLGHAIAGRGATLMLFDNFEQVVEHAEECFTAWLSAAPNARFVITSQRRLNLRAETVFELDPLSTSHGFDLFKACARKSRKGFKIKPDEVEIVEEIVRRLDGIPLAIELAAARSSVLPPHKLLKRLNHRFALLQSRDQDFSDRQRTLGNAIEWSWGLLDPWEQDALAQCSVFRGGFFLESAESVVDLSAYPDAPMVMDVITDLKDKSLLRSWELPKLPDEIRFGMYESIRDFATAKRLQTDPAAAVCARHAQHTLARGRELAEDIMGEDAEYAVNVLSVELENLVIIAQHCPDERGVEALLIAASVLTQKGPYERLRDVLDRCVNMARFVEDRSLLTAALIERCDFNRHRGAYDACQQDASEGLALADAQGSIDHLAQFHSMLGVLKYSVGDFEASQADLERGLALAQQGGVPRTEIKVLFQLADRAMYAGELSAAQRYFLRHNTLAKRTGNVAYEARASNSLGWLMARLGRFEESEQFYKDSIEVATQSSNRKVEIQARMNLGTLFFQLGRIDEAAELYGPALERSKKLGSQSLTGTILINLAILDLVQERFEQAEDRLDSIEHAIDPRMITWTAALNGFLTGLRGLTDRAESHSKTAHEAGALSKEPMAVALADLCGAGIELFETKRAADAGDTAAAQKALDAVKARIERAHAPVLDPDVEVQRSAAEQEGDIRAVLSIVEPRHAALAQRLSDRS